MPAPIPEIDQAKALQAMAVVGDDRRRLLAEVSVATERLRPLVIAAVQAGVDRVRVAELAGIGRPTLYAWLKEAGLPIGGSRGRAGGRPAKRSEKK